MIGIFLLFLQMDAWSGRCPLIHTIHWIYLHARITSLARRSQQRTGSKKSKQCGQCHVKRSLNVAVLLHMCQGRVQSISYHISLCLPPYTGP